MTRSSDQRFSPAQTRAARGLLNWSVPRLAEAARLEAEALEIYERQEADLSLADQIVLGQALYVAGVIALPDGWAGEGVRLRERRSLFTAVRSALPRGDLDLRDLPLRRQDLSPNWRALGVVVRQLVDLLNVRGGRGRQHSRG